MTSLLKHAAVVAVAGAVVSLAQAQTPAPGVNGNPQPPANPPQVAAKAKAATPAASAPVRRRSIVHHNPYPYPEHYYNDQFGGFRNPGGIGRYAEYYPPGGRFQNDNELNRSTSGPARFDQGGGAPDRAEQIQAYQAGTQRYSAIQQHIDNYSRPYIGYGVGFYGGFN